ncbi:hypothetical protein SAMN05216294_1285 [Flagellimonas zhangzhouensis]|uniref:hypothetical protein n=1 Tax=Flagellimonas zhangzhouensis TaxID=1073328 RepID=UPI00088E23E7|nr:hypothetical protein [Allomuricauda zhangzhouensis]SDQ29671.1 hypothetical protein SAMN05216294_1285 [Allomuricauda zhangzhouensis]
MDESKTAISGFLKRINLIHKAIMASPIIVGLVVYQTADNPYLLIFDAWDLLMLFAISAILLGFYLSDQLFKKYLLAIPPNASLTQKLEKFQAAFLLKMVFLEMPALICAAIFVLTQNLLYLIVIGGIVVYMSLHNTKKENIIHALDLRGGGGGKG